MSWKRKFYRTRTARSPTFRTLQCKLAVWPTVIVMSRLVVLSKYGCAYGLSHNNWELPNVAETVKKFVIWKVYFFKVLFFAYKLIFSCGFLVSKLPWFHMVLHLPSFRTMGISQVCYVPFRTFGIFHRVVCWFLKLQHSGFQEISEWFMDFWYLVTRVSGWYYGLLFWVGYFFSINVATRVASSDANFLNTSLALARMQLA